MAFCCQYEEFRGASAEHSGCQLYVSLSHHQSRHESRHHHCHSHHRLLPDASLKHSPRSLADLICSMSHTGTGNRDELK